jgi:Calcineurin-like phosphoesterase
MDRQPYKLFAVLLAACLLLIGSSVRAGPFPTAPRGVPTAKAAPAPKPPPAPKVQRAAELPSRIRIPAPAPAPKPRTVVSVQTPARRDWVRAPALVTHEPAGDVYAVSDLHGHYNDAFNLLSSNGLIAGDPRHPSTLRWIGGKSTLVVLGDVIDKGGNSLEIIDMLRGIQKSAEADGGRVIVTMGNHEAEFLANPSSEKAMRDGSDPKHRFGLGWELEHRGVDRLAVANGTDSEGRGAWLRALPMGAKVGKWFFVHSGDTGGMNEEELSKLIAAGVDREGFGSEDLVGRDGSPLGNKDWKAVADQAEHNAEALGVKHIVMGHVPSSLDAEGKIARSRDGTLVKIDTGLGDDEGPPRMLFFPAEGKIRQLDVDGNDTRVPKR